MAHSICNVYLHIIFHIKRTSPCINDEDLDRVHSYIGQLVNDTKSINIWINGVGNHVHILCLLRRDVSPSYLVEEIKRKSSRWIKSLSPNYSMFAWQNGYSAFSVSLSAVDTTLAYIKNQREHHKYISFQDEYKQILKTQGKYNSQTQGAALG